MAAHTMAVIARSVRWLWLGSLAAFKPQTGQVTRPQGASASPKVLKLHSNRTATAGGEAAVPRYTFKYRNGTQTIQTIEDMRSLEFSTDRAARRAALRNAREMANDVSWQSSARGAGWTVLVFNPTGQQICQVPVSFKKRWF